MTNRSNYQQRLDNYLDHYQRRYKPVSYTHLTLPTKA